MKIGNENVKLYLGSAEIEKIYLGTSQVYESGDTPTPPTPVPYSGQYLTFVAEADNCSIKAVDAHSNVFQYSTDSGATWNNLANNASTTSVNSGETIMFKASGLTVDSSDGIGTLKPSVRASVQGNIMSLVYGDDFTGQTTMKNGQFRGLFYGCANITSAENLILPATTLTSYCYRSMFATCTSLTTAPELPATTLAWFCYSYMFGGCSNLTTAPSILPATTLASNCYEFMFQQCTSLTVAPELPATTLETYCYKSMFHSCRNLNYIKCLATNISANSCTSSWVDGVAATGTFVKAASMSSWTSGTSGIPNGWTVQNVDGSPYIDDGGGSLDPG